MAVTANRIVQIAESQIGVKENPANSNIVKYNTWFYAKVVSGSRYPWCMTFVQWVFHQADMALPIKTPSCTSFMTAAKATGRWVTGDYKAGDVILYSFDGGTDADHVGICVSATDTTVTCIEGNTSLTSNDNGGIVMKRTRRIGLVLGAYRPAYAGETSTNPTTGGICEVTLDVLSKGKTGNSVKAMQILLIGNGYSCGKAGADGDFGSGTLSAVKKYQKAKGLTVDGIVGAKTWTALLK